MVKFINLTPHEIVLCGMKLPSEGLARCATLEQQIKVIDGVRVNHRTFGEVSGLPEPKEGIVYIVSALVAQAVSGQRDDVYVVDETVRDSEGRIIGCNALAKI